MSHSPLNQPTRRQLEMDDLRERARSAELRAEQAEQRAKDALHGRELARLDTRTERARAEQAERERDAKDDAITLLLRQVHELEAQLAKVPALVEALALERCNGCKQPRKEWGPVCGGMYQGDNTHFHSPDWWLAVFEQEQKP